MYLITKVFQREGYKKMFYGLEQLNQMIGENIVIEEEGQDHIVSEGKSYVTLFLFRNITNRKYDWLYREMSQFKNRAKIIQSVRVSIHFFERWTERKTFPFNFKNLKQEILTSNYIGYFKDARDIGFLSKEEELVHGNKAFNIYHNPFTNTTYVLDATNENIVTLWCPNEVLTEKGTDKAMNYDNVLKVMELCRRDYYIRKESLSARESYDLRNQIGRLQDCLLRQNINDMYDEIVDLDTKYCG